MKTAVVTGATGVTGRALVQVCIKAGYEVLAIVHRSSARAKELAETEHCRVLWLDLPEYGSAAEELRRQGIFLNGYELFFHLAWMAPFGKDRENLSLQVANIQAALDAVRLAGELGCSVFIGAGSQAEYGRTEGILSPDTPAFPETGYGIAKLCAGQLTRLACEQAGLRHVWCRILSVYGPHDRDQTLISTAVLDMMADRETIFSPCEQMWDYLYSEDAARALLLAGEKGKNGKVYTIGGGEACPLKDYIRKIAALTGYTREIGFGKRPYNEKQVMHLQADLTEITRDTGFNPEVSFETGIQNMINAYRSRERIG